MKDYTYLIVGGGMTADAALNGIRQEDPDGTIAVFSKETHMPYSRPPLSKALWSGKKTVNDIWLKMPKNELVFQPSCAISRLDPIKKLVVDEEGNTYRYEKLLLATGGKPRRLPFEVPGLIYYRTLDDYLHLRDQSGPGKHNLVIGGGFIGSEIAAGLSMAGSQVTMIFRGASLGGRVYPADLSKFVNDYYQKKGIRMLTGQTVDEITKEGSQYLVKTRAGEEIRADSVVAGLGIQINTQLAEAAGLTVENGIQVDESLHTSQPDIYAAGDVANFFNPTLGMRLRVEHEDNALKMGRVAGLNMARERLSRPLERYDYLPYFYSDLFELGYEAVGLLDSRLETYADWIEPFQKGVIYYLEQGRVRGVLLWNVWDQVPAARELIQNAREVSPQKLKGRLPA